MKRISSAYFYFKNDEKYSKLIVPMIVMMSIGLIGFISVSFGDLDHKITTLLFSINKNLVFMRYFTCAIFVICTTPTFILLSVLAMVLIETLYNKFDVEKYKTIYFFYTTVFALILTIESLTLSSIHKNGDGYLKDAINFQFLIDNNAYFIIRTTSMFFNITMYVSLCLWLNLKLVKSPSFIEDRYGLRAITAIFCILGSYFVIIIIKQSNGRPEYSFIHFYEIYGHPLDYNNNHITDLNTKVSNWDFSGSIVDSITTINKKLLKNRLIEAWNDNTYKPGKYINWWEINGSFANNLKYWYPWRIFTNPDISKMPIGWNSMDFPSGHTNSAITMCSIGTVFLYNKNTKIMVQKIFTASWLIYVFLLTNSLVIGGAHWISDVFFTMMFAPLSFLFLSWITNEIVIKNQLMKKQAKELIISNKDEYKTNNRKKSN